MAWRKKNLKEDLVEDKYFDEEASNDFKPKIVPPPEEEVDPLDSYMQNLEKSFKETMANPPNNSQKAERIISEDPLESYMDDVKKKLIQDYNRKNPQAAGKQEKEKNSENSEENDSDLEENQNQNYDFLNSDGEVDFEAIRKQKKRKIEPLPSIDHSTVRYPPFNKVFYEEHEQIKELPHEKVKSLRAEMEIRVKGPDVPKPIVSFAHLNFDEAMIHIITKKGFEKPTAIQCQALPCLLSGRDVIGIAKTGSGKTLAYVWPLIAHILDQKPLEKNEGPIGLILCPTRELTQQVYLEAKRYAKFYEISISALLGGESKHEQWKELKAGVEILIATPGRLIEMVKKKATNFKRCTYIVIDEADKMFSMGFEYQIRSIVGQIRPDRQTSLFTATLKKKIQNLAIDILSDPVIINIGKDDQANEDVKQEVIVIKNENQKFLWLVTNLKTLLSRGKVLIFVNHIKSCDELSKEIKMSMNIDSMVLHGDKLQQERTQIVNSFKTDHHILIATDIASRGLDVPAIKSVINFECPKDGDTHIHRVGRTGRAGDKDGVAYTLILRNEIKFAIILMKNLELSGQRVPPELEEMAMGDDGFKRNKIMKKMGLKKSNDVSKLIEKAFKRGKKTTSGLGYVEEENNTKTKEIKGEIMKEMQINLETQKNMQQMPNQQQPMEYNANIYQNNQINNYPPNQKEEGRTGNFLDNPLGRSETRQEILSEYSSKFKNSMQFQFRNSFTSAGSFQPKNNLPTITYIGKPPTHVIPSKEEKESEKYENNIPFRKREEKFAKNYYKIYERERERSPDEKYRSKETKKKKSSNWDLKKD